LPAIVNIREVFKAAVMSNAAAIILCHNHPSGDPTPSPEDVAITRKIKDAGTLLDIELLDHIVLGNPDWVSLRERGLGF
jgi:DNA repair protein RadC